MAGGASCSNVALGALGKGKEGSLQMEAEDGAAEASELGRKEHWDAVYADELANLREHGDEGELWFGEDVMDTMVDWTAELLRQHSSSDCAPLDAAILDVGTGNGVLPLQLARLGFTNVTGSDYSEAAVELARSIAARRGVTAVRWQVDDFLHSALARRFDVITDKGTFDAVGLSEGAAAKRELYVQAAAQLLKPHGLLVITSCNNTRQELESRFCRSDGARTPLFKCVDHVRTYLTFCFGGCEGSRVCTVALRRL